MTEVKDFSYEALKQEVMPLIKELDVENVSSMLAYKDIENKMDYEETERLKAEYFEDRNLNAMAIEKSDPFFSSFSSEEDSVNWYAKEKEDNDMRFSFKDQVTDEQTFKDNL